MTDAEWWQSRLLDRGGLALVSQHVPPQSIAGLLHQAKTTRRINQEVVGKCDDDRAGLSLTPEDSLLEAVRLMELSRASSLPVMDGSGALVGLLLNKGLITRLGTRRHSWWRSLFDGRAESAGNYLKRVGTVGDAMSSRPPSVSPELSSDSSSIRA